MMHIHTREVPGAYGAYWEATAKGSDIRGCGFTTADAIDELLCQLEEQKRYRDGANLYSGAL